MTRILALFGLAVFAASSGCQTVAPYGQFSSAGAPSHVAQSQMAPRPEIMRTACHTGGCCQGGAPCGDQVGCGGSCDYCGGSGVCGGCGGGGCNNCGGSGGCICGGCFPGWCGLCNRYCGCECDPGGYGRPGSVGVVNSAVAAVARGGYKDNVYDFNPGPPTAQVAYPYYTVRGPRDFLRNNPPPLGPY